MRCRIIVCLILLLQAGTTFRVGDVLGELIQKHKKRKAGASSASAGIQKGAGRTLYGDLELDSPELENAQKATLDTIKKQHRELAKKYHPDKHQLKEEQVKQEAAEKFRQVQHAYEILSDPEKRARYDLSLFDGNSGRGLSFCHFIGNWKIKVPGNNPDLGGIRVWTLGSFTQSTKHEHVTEHPALFKIEGDAFSPFLTKLESGDQEVRVAQLNGDCSNAGAKPNIRTWRRFGTKKTWIWARRLEEANRGPCTFDGTWNVVELGARIGEVSVPNERGLFSSYSGTNILFDIEGDGRSSPFHIVVVDDNINKDKLPYARLSDCTAVRTWTHVSEPLVSEWVREPETP